MKTAKGLTLVELLIAVFLLSVGIASTLMFFSNAMLSADFAGDISVASTHAEHVLEEMKSRRSLEEIQGTNWQEWALQQDFNMLPNERVEVNFGNIEGALMDVTAQIHWIKRARDNQVSFMTTLSR